MTHGKSAKPPLDLKALREKYRLERHKRLREDGNAQYLEPVGNYAHFLDDPYAQPTPRTPRTDEVTAAFIGGGFAGLITGARLKQAGIDDVCIIEKGGDFGGTWYWNRYPGAQCDTASMVYMPLLEETGHIPTEKYAHGPELLQHCRHIAGQFGLYDNACLSTEVTSLQWDASDCRWVIGTNHGDRIRARFVGMGTGPLHRPKLPGIEGIQTFAGHSFHTSRWDYAYTGGGPAGELMDKLGDKRVGIIGTGATAVQCVPHLSKACGQLFVFQRTPSSIDVRNNHPIDPEWFSSLKPGWQGEWLMNFTMVQSGGFAYEDLVKDGWTEIAWRIREKLLSSPNPEFSREGFLRAYYESDDEKMSEIRARVDAIVSDPATAEALKPWYRQLCKRPCFHDEYLQSFNRSNTHLIDTDGKGVERIDEAGVWAGGRHYPIDCLIFASGFEVGTEYARRSGYDVVGRKGLLLSQHWSDGMRSLHGMHMHGFPNLFLVTPTQGGNLISNIPHNITESATTIAAIIAHGLSMGCHEVEVTKQAESDWVELLESGGRRLMNMAECTPGYYNNEGQDPGVRGVRNSMGYPQGPAAFFRYLDEWRSSGQFQGLEFR